MPVIKRNAAVQTAMYAISVLLMRGLSFFMLPFVVGQLSQHEYGVLELLSTIAIFSSVVFSFGIEHALYRFVGGESKPQVRTLVMSRIYSLALLLCVLALLLSPMLANVVVSVLGDKALYNTVWFMFASLSFETLISVPLAWLRMNDRSFAFCTVALLSTAVRALFVVVLLLDGNGIASIFQAGLVASIFSVCLLTALLRKELTLSWPVTEIKKYLVYGLPLVGSGLLAFLLSGFDRWVLAGHITMEQLAVYAIGMKFALLMSFAMQPFGMWYMPKRLDILRLPNGVKRSSDLSCFGLHLTLFMALGIGLGAPLFIDLFLPATYASAVTYVPFFIAWACLKEMSEFVLVGCLAQDKTHRQFHAQLIATGVGIVLIFCLVPRFHEVGVLLSLGTAHLLRFGLLHRFSQQVVRLQIEVFKVFGLFSVVMLLIALQCILLQATLAEQLVFAMLSLLLYLGLLCLVLRRELQIFLTASTRLVTGKVA